MQESSAVNKSAARKVSEHRNGPPAMMPAPAKLAEWARCSCTVMKAPDDKPEIELLRLDAL
jgi:hypothetical protein